MSEKVGIRRLRENLSHYLGQVREGHILVITDRGDPMGRIVPYTETVEDTFERLDREGKLRRGEGGFKPIKGIKLRENTPLASDIIIENRE